MNFFSIWRRKKGLDYNGWWQFIIKRWLRRHKLGWVIPFDFYQDDYDDSYQHLIVYRWGKKSIETYLWSGRRDIEILDRLRNKGVINKRILYKVIQAETTLKDKVKI